MGDGCVSALHSRPLTDAVCSDENASPPVAGVAVQDPKTPSARINFKVLAIKDPTPAAEEEEPWSGEAWVTLRFFPIHSMAAEESNILGRQDLGTPKNPFLSAIEGDGIESERISARSGTVG